MTRATIGYRSARAFFGAGALILFFGAPATARVLEVGPAQEFKVPSAAAAVASAGDIVEIEPGEYFDCAIWHASGVTIAAKGPGVVITDKTCAGKGLFVIDGSDVTIRGLTFARARVPDGNGAGIRAEGKNLTIEASRFIDNETGILAAADFSDGKIRIIDSEFIGNGKCAGSCTHALSVGHILLLRVENSRFIGTKGGHHIRSQAMRTELVGNRIEDGPDGTSSYLVDLPNGGSLVMEGNRLEKGPHTGNDRAAIMIGDERATQPSVTLLFKSNEFVNDTGERCAFVLNWGDGEPTAEGNRFSGLVTEVSTRGAWIHGLRGAIGRSKTAVIDLAKSAARRIRDW